MVKKVQRIVEPRTILTVESGKEIHHLKPLEIDITEICPKELTGLHRKGLGGLEGREFYQEEKECKKRAVEFQTLIGKLARDSGYHCKTRSCPVAKNTKDVEDKVEEHFRKCTET